MSKRKIDLELAFSMMNLPEMHRDAKLANIPEQCPHKKHIVDITDNIRDFVFKGHNLLLWGDFGYGKSATSSILLKAALSRGIIGFWLSCDEYIGHVMKNGWWDDETSMEEKCKETPLLVLDELILRENSKQKEAMLEMLIRFRLEKSRSTIITTNHSMSWMKTNYQSLYSVFNGHYHILQTKGHDFRAN